MMNWLCRFLRCHNISDGTDEDEISRKRIDKRQEAINRLLMADQPAILAKLRAELRLSQEKPSA